MRKTDKKSRRNGKIYGTTNIVKINCVFCCKSKKKIYSDLIFSPNTYIKTTGCDAIFNSFVAIYDYLKYLNFLMC